eukprot:2607059-Rhodomonas_salina.1
MAALALAEDIVYTVPDDVRILDFLGAPCWMTDYSPDDTRFVWANTAGLQTWGKKDLENLKATDISGVSLSSCRGCDHPTHESNGKQRSNFGRQGHTIAPSWESPGAQHLTREFLILPYLAGKALGLSPYCCILANHAARDKAVFFHCDYRNPVQSCWWLWSEQVRGETYRDRRTMYPLGKATTFDVIWRPIQVSARSSKGPCVSEQLAAGSGASSRWSGAA